MGGTCSRLDDDDSTYARTTQQLTKPTLLPSAQHQRTSAAAASSSGASLINRRQQTCSPPIIVARISPRCVLEWSLQSPPESMTSQSATSISAALNVNDHHHTQKIQQRHSTIINNPFVLPSDEDDEADHNDDESTVVVPFIINHNSNSDGDVDHASSNTIVVASDIAPMEQTPQLPHKAPLPPPLSSPVVPPLRAWLDLRGSTSSGTLLSNSSIAIVPAPPLLVLDDMFSALPSHTWAAGGDRRRLTDIEKRNSERGELSTMVDVAVPAPHRPYRFNVPRTKAFLTDTGPLGNA